MTMTDPKKHQEINDLLTGPPTTTPRAVRAVAPRSPDEIAPPPWWRGDDDAYQGSMVARSQART